jgi:hypothetical protein
MRSMVEGYEQVFATVSASSVGNTRAGHSTSFAGPPLPRERISPETAPGLR